MFWLKSQIWYPSTWSLILLFPWCWMHLHTYICTKPTLVLSLKSINITSFVVKTLGVNVTRLSCQGLTFQGLGFPLLRDKARIAIPRFLGGLRILTKLCAVIVWPVLESIEDWGGGGSNGHIAAAQFLRYSTVPLALFSVFWHKWILHCIENEIQSAFDETLIGRAQDDIVRTLRFRVNALCDCLAGFRV